MKPRTQEIMQFARLQMGYLKIIRDSPSTFRFPCQTQDFEQLGFQESTSLLTSCDEVFGAFGWYRVQGNLPYNAKVYPTIVFPLK